MQIGHINIPQAVLLAPMDGVSDIPFRLIHKKLGADITFTEFVNSEGLIRNSEKTKQKMLFLEDERPFGIQIYGGAETPMEKAAKMAEELQPDIIDINCGCWVKNVVRSGAGADLLRNLPKMQKIISTIVKSVNLPVTVKTRLGWDEKSIQIVEVSKMIEDSGAKALTIHCRTRAQGQKGKPDYSWILKVKKVVSIPIIVNGGILSHHQAKEVFDTTGCDGIMIARGSIQNPWIFREIKYFLKTGQLLPSPSIAERIELLIKHINLSVQYKGERRGVIEFRKFYKGYLHGQPNNTELRTELMTFTNLNPILNCLDRYLNKYG